MSRFRREHISSAKRFRILQRDRFTCRYCGRSAPEVQLEVDHVVAVTVGGSNKDDNLVAACKACNASKSAKSVDAPQQPSDWSGRTKNSSEWPVGSYFFTFKDNGRWCYSGRVKGKVGDAYRVAIFSAVTLMLCEMLEENGEQIVTPEEMRGWQFENTEENFWFAARRHREALNA